MLSLDTRGKSPSSTTLSLFFKPNIFWIEGPVMSASKIPTLNPSFFNLIANKDEITDFPTPPLPLPTAIILLIKLDLLSNINTS